MLLNFGHTLGHAIEKSMDYKGISHGEAVAVGMYQISKISERAGWTQSGTSNEIGKALSIAGLPIESAVAFKDDFLSALRSDKKRLGNSLNLIVLKEIGEAEIRNLTMNQVEALF